MVAVVLALLLGDVLTQASTLKEGAALRKANAVATTPYYLAGGVSTANDQALALLGEHATTGTGYSAVINNIAINDPDVLGGTSALIVTGPVVFEVFTRLGTGCPAPCVLRGADLPTTTEPLHFRGLIIPQGAMLPRGAVWFDPNAAGVNLDDVQLLVLGPDHYRYLDNEEKEELLTRAVLLNPSDHELHSFIAGAAAGGLSLVPARLSEEQPDVFSDLMTRAALYVVALIAFALLLGLAYSAIVRTMAAREQRALIIRRMCGGTQGRLGARIVSYPFLVSRALPLLMCVLLSVLGPPLRTGAAIVATLVVVVLALGSAGLLHATRKQKV